MLKISKVVALLVISFIIFSQSNLAFASNANNACSVFENLWSSNVTELKYIKDDFVTNSKVYRGKMHELNILALVDNGNYRVKAFSASGYVSDSSSIVEYISKRFNSKYQKNHNQLSKSEDYWWILNNNTAVTLSIYEDGQIILALNLTTLSNVR